MKVLDVFHAKSGAVSLSWQLSLRCRRCFVDVLVGGVTDDPAWVTVDFQRAALLLRAHTGSCPTALGATFNRSFLYFFLL
jgi:hypothetical protein